MNKNLTKLALLGFMGLMGTLAIGVTSAYEVTYHPEANVSYTLNSGFDTSGEFTAGLITITDGNETYTIMDRNLGATKSGSTCSSSDLGACGYYFQWGNNYGFSSDPGASIITSSTKVDASGYGPGNYYSSSIFIIMSPYLYNYDRSSVINDNLRGGVSGTYEAMQGPCPEGYHVPSSGEWLGLSTMLGFDGDPWSETSLQVIDSLNTELYLPFAGDRHFSSSGVYNQGIYAYYWSSTAFHRYDDQYGNRTDGVYNLSFKSGFLSIGNIYGPAYAFPVRCFKDSALGSSSSECPEGTHEEGDECVDNEQRTGCLQSGEIPSNSIYNVINVTGVWNSGTSSRDIPACSWTCNDKYSGDNCDIILENLKIWLNNGEILFWSGVIESGTKISDLNLNFNKSNSYEIFNGLYINPELTQIFDIETPIIHDLELYLGYISGDTWIDRNKNPFEWENISICKPSDPTMCITLMDRNLGASTSGIVCSKTNSGACGSHFEWGNNHGFLSCIDNRCTSFPGGEIAKNGRTNTSNYGPNNPYNSGVLYYGDTEWSSVRNDNLWGGSGDNVDNNRGYDIDNHSVINVEGRQGPCPEGYHVPSIGEIGILLKYWAENYISSTNILELQISDESLLPYFNNNETGVKKLQEDLKVPFAGIRRNDYPYVFLVGSNAIWGSSSARNGKYARGLVIDTENVYGNDDYARSLPTSIRCFKDSPFSFYRVSFGYLSGDSLMNICSGLVLSGNIVSTDLARCVSEYNENNAKTGYKLMWTVSGENTNFDIDTDTVITGMDLVANWTPIHDVNNNGIADEEESFTVTWKDGDTVISTGLIAYGETPSFIPTKDGYNFAGWIPSIQPVTGDVEYTATWIAKAKPSSGGGGGGSTLRKDNCPGGDYSDSYYDGECGMAENDTENGGEGSGDDNNKDSSATPQNDSKASTGATNKSSGTEGEGSKKDSSSQAPQNDKTGHNSADDFQYDTTKFNPKYSDEMNQAYQFSYHYGITTKDTIRNADVNGKLTRIAMAKMLSQYAINVLGMKPDKTRINQFADVSEKLDSDYDNGVTLAYQLGIMGINMPNNEFLPYNYVTRAQFVTALSRLLYKTKDGTDKYYSTHMAKLYNEGIITNTDPTMLERRGYVMLMLMRSENSRE